MVPATLTAFDGFRRLASGPAATVALGVRAALDERPDASILVFDGETGSQIDLDLRGTEDAIRARFAVLAQPAANGAADGPAQRGRPRLGVVAREVTLLPRHWDWLATQSGGASAALRRLIDAARQSDAGTADARARRDAAYRVMAALAGDLPGSKRRAVPSSPAIPSASALS